MEEQCDHGVRAGSFGVDGCERITFLRAPGKPIEGLQRPIIDRSPFNEQANRRQGGQTLRHQTQGRVQVRLKGRHISTIYGHPTLGRQNAGIRKIPATIGEVNQTPSDPQEHEGFGFLAVYKLRLVLLSRLLPVCGGRRRDGDLRQMFGVCAAQGGERSRHHLAAAAVQEPSIHSDGIQAANFEADARMADFPATETKRRAVGWAGWNFSQSLSGGLF